MRFRKIPETAQRNISGLRLREARLAQEPALSQEQLSVLLAEEGLVLERLAITKIENGRRCVFDHELKHFSKVLNRSADWFLGLDEVSKEKSKAGKKAASKPRSR